MEESRNSSQPVLLPQPKYYYGLDFAQNIEDLDFGFSPSSKSLVDGRLPPENQEIPITTYNYQSNGHFDPKDSHCDFFIGLDHPDHGDQSSSNNSPFQSAAEDVGNDGDVDRHPLLIKSPPRQSVFHQFLTSAKAMKDKGKSKLLPQPYSYPSKSRSQVEQDEQLHSDDENDQDPQELKEGPQQGRKCSVGILLAAISCIFFATSALIVKVSSLHPMQLLCVRGLVQAILISPIVISSGNSFLGPAGSRALLLARAVLGAVSLIMSFASIHLIPLADAATCIFTSPVFVSLFACICLGELCSWFDVTMIVLTLLGVILVSQPSFNFITSGSWGSIVGTVCGLSAAMLTALAFIVLRQLKHVHFSCVVLWFSVVLAAFGAVLTVALDGFTLPTQWSQILDCVGIGVCGFFGQILLTKALQIENAGPCAVARTLDIVLAFFYQITLLHDTPDWYSYLGSFLVVSCVLLTAFRRWYREKFVAHGLRDGRSQSQSNNRNCHYTRANTDMS